MKRTVQTLDQVRQFFTENARQVQVEGVADSVAVGYVRHQAGQFTYAVFYSRQSKPAKHFAARSEADAEQRIINLLAQAGKGAERRAEERKSGRAPFFDRQEGDITCRSYTVARTAQLIREALKIAFPGVKFSVISDSFANGTSVDIRYTDGPSRKQVEQVYAPFISGRYNSAADRYEQHREPTTIDSTGKLFRLSYGAKYIGEHRSYSPAYGFFLNALDLRQAPPLAEQFAAFEQWHSAQRYAMQTSWGENAGTYTVSSNRASRDLEHFAEALTVQGYAPELTTAGDEVTLTVKSRPSAAPAVPAQQPAQEPADDQTAREYQAAEMQWLSDPGQDRTDREFEAAERGWLA